MRMSTLHDDLLTRFFARNPDMSEFESCRRWVSHCAYRAIDFVSIDKYSVFEVYYSFLVDFVFDLDALAEYVATQRY